MKSHRLAQLPCGTCISLILKRVGNGVRSRNCLFLALLFFSFQLAGSAAKAQSAVRILGKIDDARVVRIEVAKGERWIEFSGTAGQVENAFHTELHYYQVEANLHLAHATDLALPEKLAAVLRGVASLNNFGKRPPRKMIRGVVGRDAQGRKVQLQHNLTAVGTTNTYYLAPGDFAATPRPVFPRKPFPARVHL